MFEIKEVLYNFAKGKTHQEVFNYNHFRGIFSVNYGMKNFATLAFPEEGPFNYVYGQSKVQGGWQFVAGFNFGKNLNPEEIVKELENSGLIKEGSFSVYGGVALSFPEKIFLESKSHPERVESASKVLRDNFKGLASLVVEPVREIYSF